MSQTGQNKFFESVTPESVGIPSKALQQYVEQSQKDELNLHSIIILRHGKVAMECYFAPYAQDREHVLFSLSKSFTSTAAGFAVQEGLLSIDDKIIDFFPEKLPCKPCDYMREVTVGNLLSMASGHSVEPNAMKGEDWVYNFLTSYIDKEPGSLFTYNTAGTYMVSAIVQKVTGQTVFEYLKPRLFEPLGFSDKIWWEESPQGVSCGGYGFNVTTRDLARFGQFYLQRGNWEGKQLLNADWVDLATKKHIDNSGNPDWQCGYGFQFWRCQPEGVYRGDGAFGQYCVVMPKQDAVFVATAGTMDIQKTLQNLWDIVLPTMTDTLPENKEDADALAAYCSTLEMPADYNCETSPIAKEVSGITYDLSSNPMLFDEFSAQFGEDTDVLSFGSGYGDFTCTVKHGAFTDNKLPTYEITDAMRAETNFYHIDNSYRDRTAKGGWLDENTYRVYLYGTYYTTLDVFTIHFDTKRNACSVKMDRRSDFSPYIRTALGIAR